MWRRALRQQYTFDGVSRRIEYDYDAEGKLTRATAYDLAGTAIVAESRAEYYARSTIC